MKTIGSLITVACVAFICGCAATVPSELTNARLAYQHASDGPAAQLAPAELHVAQEALSKAEKSFSKDAESYQTRDLAYVAQRKAEMADAQASIAKEKASKTRADNDYQKTQGNILQEKTQDLQEKTQDLLEKTQDLNQAQAALAVSEQSRQAKAAQLSAEQKARLEAEQKASEAQAALAKLAAIKEDERGLVITLSGSVLFRSDEAILLPGAESKLDQVVEALSSSSDRNVVVEGYTDSQGSDSHNLDLSQRRADAVRNYLVHKGYPAGRVSAKGIGEERPIADNATSEGRANNRRVEIVLEHPAKP